MFNLNMFKTVSAAIVLALLVSGCAGGVASRIETFHRVAPNAALGKRLAILPQAEEDIQSLEFAAYRNTIAMRFAQKGFVIVETAAQADWLAKLDYGVDDGVTQRSLVYGPHYGWPHDDWPYYGGPYYGGHYYGGPYYGGPYYGRHRFRPYGYRSYGWGHPPAYVVDRTTYTRVLVIEIVDRSSADRGEPEKLYRGRALSQGPCGSLMSVFDAMSEALLQDWPGDNGAPRTVVVPADGTC